MLPNSSSFLTSEPSVNLAGGREKTCIAMAAENLNAMPEEIGGKIVSSCFEP